MCLILDDYDISLEAEVDALDKPVVRPEWPSMRKSNRFLRLALRNHAPWVTLHLNITISPAPTRQSYRSARRDSPVGDGTGLR